jgi:hypothetical protein
MKLEETVGQVLFSAAAYERGCAPARSQRSVVVAARVRNRKPKSPHATPACGATERKEVKEFKS